MNALVHLDTYTHTVYITAMLIRHIRYIQKGVALKRFIAITIVWLIAFTIMAVAVAPDVLAAGEQAVKPFSDFIENLIKIAQGIAGTLAVLMLVFGAIKLKTSQGNPQAQQQAKVTIAGSIAGLLLVVFAKDIIALILNAKG